MKLDAMSWNLFAAGCLVAMTVGGSTASGQDAAPPRRAELDQEQLEADFVEMLTDSQLVGYFTLVDDEGKDLLDDTLNEERYTIKSIEKMSGDNWLFNARIQYLKNDYTVPIPVKVKWAGDTPVVQVTDFSPFGSGPYTSRVLFFRGEYAGTWSAPQGGGQLFGRIEKLPKEGEDSSDGAVKDGDEEGGAPLPVSLDVSTEGTDHWPQFRGPNAEGRADGHALPTKWDVEEGVGVHWRTAVPGLAHSSPIIWGDHVFVTTSVSASGEAELTVGLYGSIEPVENEGPQKFQLHRYDKHDGSLAWSKTLWEGEPDVKRHPKGSHAACTPATDGEHVVAFFGSEGLYCYTVDGEHVWTRDLGSLDSGYYLVPEAQWGFSSCPVIYEDMVLVQCDVQGQSFLAALSMDDGSDVWRTDRDEVPTWGTPTLDLRDGREQVIVNGYRHIGGYDLWTGGELWNLVGGGDIPVPTPIIDGNTVFITNAHGQMAPIYAIDLDASGEVTMNVQADDAMLWMHRRRGNYMQTPLVVDDLLYCCSDAGVLAAYDKTTGEEIYRERLGTGGAGFTASGVAGDGKLYFTSEEGDIHVLKAGRTFERLSVNSMGSTCMATPAISGGVMFWRTRGHLVAIKDA